MQLFYQPEVAPGDYQIIFSREESRHIGKVLRKTEGDILHVTNGKGYLFKTEILNLSSKHCTGKIIEVEEETPPQFHIHLAVAPTKMNDRYEWFLEKATEIGIQEITPVLCSNSERKTIKTERFEKVLQSAMKQSLHLRMPTLHPLKNFEDFVKADTKGLKFIAHCEDNKPRTLLKEVISPRQNISILIGPEGDFTETEIDIALQYGWKPVSLGKSRLRTETAAIVACHTVVLANE